MDERLLLKEMAKIKSSWSQVLKDEASKDYFQKLDQHISKLNQSGLTFYPPLNQIFSAFKLTDLLSTKVVILGQDPYHGPGQAHGLSFSVRKDIPLPPSLKNIFKELESDLGIAPSPHGDLTHWAKQGVFMLNSILTVEPGLPGSHQTLGWEFFTDSIFRTLNEREKPLVFILWGAFAQKRQKLIDLSKHLVISSPHPSPLSCYRGFYGSKPFSKANGFLATHLMAPINWRLPP